MSLFIDITILYCEFKSFYWLGCHILDVWKKKSVLLINTFMTVGSRSIFVDVLIVAQHHTPPPYICILFLYSFILCGFSFLLTRIYTYLDLICSVGKTTTFYWFWLNIMIFIFLEMRNLCHSGPMTKFYYCVITYKSHQTNHALIHINIVPYIIKKKNTTLSAIPQNSASIKELANKLLLINRKIKSFKILA